MIAPAAVGCKRLLGSGPCENEAVFRRLTLEVAKTPRNARHKSALPTTNDLPERFDQGEIAAVEGAGGGDEMALWGRSAVREKGSDSVGVLL